MPSHRDLKLAIKKVKVSQGMPNPHLHCLASLNPTTDSLDSIPKLMGSKGQIHNSKRISSRRFACHGEGSPKVDPPDVLVFLGFTLFRLAIPPHPLAEFD